MFIVPLPVLGENVITFTLESVGKDRAFINFKTTEKTKLNVSTIASGKVVKVSVVNSSFAEQEPATRSGIVKSITQVKRGVYNDLYINLEKPVSLDLIDKIKTYEIYLKSQDLLTAPIASPIIADAPQQKLPIRIVSNGLQNSNSGITLVFPNFNSVSPVSSLLHASAYSIDFLWYWIMGIDQPNSSSCQNDQKLIHDLTSELIELRKQLTDRRESTILNQTENRNVQEN